MTVALSQEQLEFRNKIYDIIFWTSLALIALWYFLKVFGIINTPLWVEMFPVIVAVFSAGAFFQRMFGDIQTLKHNVGSLDKRVDHLENDVHYVKSRL